MNRRNFLKALGIGTAVVLSSKSAFSQITAEPERRIIEENYLYVLPGNTHPMARISIKDGEFDLENIASSYLTEKEENWLHFTNGKESIWTDISDVQSINMAYIDTKFISSIIRQTCEALPENPLKREWTWYHLHPILAVELFYNSVISTFEKRYTEIKTPKMPDTPKGAVLTEDTLELFSLPSSSDITAYTTIEQLARYELEITNPAKVFGPAGTYTFMPDSKLNDKSYLNDLSGIQGLKSSAILAGYGIDAKSFRDLMNRSAEKVYDTLVRIKTTSPDLNKAMNRMRVAQVSIDHQMYGEKEDNKKIKTQPR